MSLISLSPNASGTGVFTVASPNSNVDRVLTLPDESGTVDTLQRSGNVVQVVNFQTGAFASGTTTIPFDDTIPQITEGDEYMTLAITPTNASNILRIDVVIGTVSCSLSSRMVAALFLDAGANALASCGAPMAINDNENLALIHWMVSDSTSSLTFKVRVGGNNGTTNFNGGSGARLYGGVLASSITITEMTP